MARRKLTVANAVKGKVIERIVIDNDEYLEIDIQFKDKTSIGISIESGGVLVRRVDLLGWKKGNSHVIKELM